MKISKPDMAHVWAEGGSISIVPNEKISQGWVAEVPLCEQMNFVQNRQDAGIAYLLQQGTPEWGDSIEYQAGTSYVQYLGAVYKATGTGTNKDPVTFPAFWTVAFDIAGSAQTVQQQLTAIEVSADPFTQYLLKTYAKKFGIGTDLFTTNLLDYVNLNVIEDGVWQYTTTCINSPFTYGKISQNTSGLVKYQSVESLYLGTATRTSTSGVFTAWQYAVTNAVAVDLSVLQAQVAALVANEAARATSVELSLQTQINNLSSIINTLQVQINALTSSSWTAQQIFNVAHPVGSITLYNTQQDIDAYNSYSVYSSWYDGGKVFDADSRFAHRNW